MYLSLKEIDEECYFYPLSDTMKHCVNVNGCLLAYPKIPIDTPKQANFL